MASCLHALHVVKECVVSVGSVHLRVTRHDVTLYGALRLTGHTTELL